MGAYNFTSVIGDGEDGGEIMLSGLKKYTRYLIVVQAYNEVGSGPLSEQVSTETLEDGNISFRCSETLIMKNYSQCLVARRWIFDVHLLRHRAFK